VKETRIPSSKKYRAVFYFQDIFFSLEATRDNPEAFLSLPDAGLMKVFNKEIASVITRSLGKIREARVGNRLGGKGWGIC